MPVKYKSLLKTFPYILISHVLWVKPTHILHVFFNLGLQTSVFTNQCLVKMWLSILYYFITFPHS